MNAAAAPVLLLVTEAEDASLRDALARVSRTGLRIERSDTVYEAMARLATGRQFERVLLDVRRLDRHEMAFVRLAPRYFPGLVIDTSWLSDADAPETTGEAARIVAEPRESVVNSEFAVTLTEAPETDSGKGSAFEPISTSGTETDPSSQSLHDAVRQRMAAEGRSAPMRRPPTARTPPGEIDGPGEGR
jgi:hypothetical protein